MASPNLDLDREYNDAELKVGDIFANVNEAKLAVKRFGAPVFADFKVNTNNKDTLKFCCKNGGRKRKKTCKGERINQHYNNMGCRALITFYKSKKADGSVTCTKIINDHCHALSEALYKHDNLKLAEEEVDLCANLRNANAKPSQIKRILKDRFKKDITIQKLKNLMKKIPITENEGTVEFEEFFTAMEEDGGQADWLDDPDGSVRCLTFTSAKMLKAFQSSDPPLVQLDTTFELEEARYKLMAAVYLNSTTNKSEVAFMALMCDETNQTMDFAISRLKLICLRYTLVFIVDKDFGQLSVLTSLFPEARVLLCHFHAIKFMRTLIASAPILVEKKKNILLQFKTLLYSNTEEIYKKEEAKFIRTCRTVTVKSGQSQVSLADYYVRNWQSCKAMWVRCFRKSLPCMGDNTSNRVERYFWTVKKAFKDTFMTLPSTVIAAVHLIKFADQRLDEKYMFSRNKVLVIHHRDPGILENNEKASLMLNDRGCVLFHASQVKLSEKLDKFSADDDGQVTEKFSGESSRSYNTTLVSCSCSFVATHQAPCPHILFRRQASETEIFSSELFHPRYLRVSTDFNNDDEEDDVWAAYPEQNDATEDVDEENNNESNVLVLDDKQKYAMVTPILLRIGNLIACHPTKKFLRYLDGLNELEKRVRNGQNFMLSIDRIVAEAEDDESEVEVPDDPVGDANIQNVLGNEDDREDTPIDDIHNDSQDTVKQIETSQEESEQDVTVAEGRRKRKFGELVFKTGLKTKGRPRKRSKQFTFNKGAADKKTKGSKASERKNRIDNSNSEDSETDEDEDSEMKLDDDSDSDFDGTEKDSSQEEEITFTT